MSSLMDGINNIYSLTAQISALQSASSGGTQSTDSLELSLEQNFNQMLSDLVSTDDNEEDDKDNYDPFVFMTASNQQYLNLLNSQNTINDTSTTAISSGNTEMDNLLTLFQQSSQSNNSYLYSLLYGKSNLEI